MKKLFYSLAAITVSVALWITCSPPDLSHGAVLVVAVCIGALGLWLIEPIPVTMSSIAIILALALTGVCTLEQALVGLASPSVFLIMLGFMIAEAVNETPAGRRLAFLIMKRFPATPGGWLAGLFCVLLVLSFFIPGYGVRTALCLPLIEGLVGEAERFGLGEGFSKMMLLGLAYGGTISGLATLPSSVSNVFAADLLRTQAGISLTYWQWARAGLPLSIALLGCAWGVLVFGLKVPKGRPRDLALVLSRELERLEPMGPREKRCLAVLGLVMALWAAEPITGWHASLPAAIGVLLLASPGIGVAKWKNMLRISWDTVLLVGASVSLSNALNDTGAASYLSKSLFSFQTLRSAVFMPFVGAILIGAVLAVYHVFMTSSLTVIATVLPLVLSLAMDTGHDPRGISVLTAAASFNGFILVTQNLPNLAVYSTGKIRNGDMFMPGILLSVVSILVTALITATLWPAMGMPPW